MDIEARAKPRRGAPPKGDVSARERILGTACELFYREGIRAIGAFATERDRSFWEWWDRIEAQYADDPRALLDALLSEIARRIGDSSFRGCPFLNLVTEFPDQNFPGRVIARANKEEMRARLATIVAKLGVSDPNRTASQLALMINGASVTGLVVGPVDLKGDLADAAMKLLA